jgi:Fur family ferric uptake transcriptional regulator|tara:strand:- start:6 stop:440 length:435 start_codon:yes stop_codon:yes gene_type:complete
MQDSKKILSDNNVSITNPRILVLEALLDNKSPITVDELLTKLENQVAKSTLYRVLSDLKKINILQEFTNLENQSVVELLLDTDSHHHHLFCSDCGEIIDVEMANEFEEKLSKEIKRIEKKFNFIIEDHRLELFGKCTDLCENCS